jgi:hypothetical protein
MVMPTSLGLRSCGEALRGDLPPDTRTRLAEHLPIADEWDGVRDFWEALDLPRLSSVITLRASHQGARPDDTAAGVLQERASSFLRCLKNSTDDLNPGIITKWPPSVLAVKTLTITATASADGQIITDWQTDAFLEA